jgi:hypothetical protein
MKRTAHVGYTRNRAGKLVRFGTVREMNRLQKLVREGQATVMDEKHIRDGMGGWEHIVTVTITSPPASVGLYHTIEQAIRAWGQWSPSEERDMDAIVDDIMAHVIDGGGTPFIQAWVQHNLEHLLPRS